MWAYPTPGGHAMPVQFLRSIDKLDAMVKTFVDRDDKKLGQGEVEALAAFYGGLPKASQAKIADRLAEVYRDSSYTKGTKERFLAALTAQGLPIDKLEGVADDTATGFLKMSREAQLERIKGLASDYGDGFSKDVTKRAVPAGARTAITAALEKVATDYLRRSPDAELGEPSFRAVYLAEGRDGRGKELVGYAVLQPIYADDHDVDQTHFFNVKGQHLGHEYSGE
ncbi:hypothetical protein L6R52_26965 [Myxococcota bacterium]|nr:hypothetical protein [Myxococcota bacterium]